MTRKTMRPDAPHDMREALRRLAGAWPAAVGLEKLLSESVDGPSDDACGKIFAALLEKPSRTGTGRTETKEPTPPNILSFTS